MVLKVSLFDFPVWVLIPTSVTLLQIFFNSKNQIRTDIYYCTEAFFEWLNSCLIVQPPMMNSHRYVAFILAFLLSHSCQEPSFQSFQLYFLIFLLCMRQILCRCAQCLVRPWESSCKLFSCIVLSWEWNLAPWLHGLVCITSLPF